jgi:hypothetical protein
MYVCMYETPSSLTRNRKYPDNYPCEHCKRELPVDYFPRRCFDKLHPGGVMPHANSWLSKAYYASDCPKPNRHRRVKLVCHQCLSYFQIIENQSRDHYDANEVFERTIPLHLSDVNGTSMKMLNEEEKNFFQTKAVISSKNKSRSSKNNHIYHNFNSVSAKNRPTDDPTDHSVSSCGNSNGDDATPERRRGRRNSPIIVDRLGRCQGGGDGDKAVRPKSSPAIQRNTFNKLSSSTMAMHGRGMFEGGVATIASTKWHAELLKGK